jgi:hypothetical protein
MAILASDIIISFQLSLKSDSETVQVLREEDVMRAAQRSDVHL